MFDVPALRERISNAMFLDRERRNGESIRSIDHDVDIVMAEIEDWLLESRNAIGEEDGG